MTEVEKVRPDDEGEVLMAINVKDNHLLISFPKPVGWIGLHKDGVEKLISTLQEKLKEMA